MTVIATIMPAVAKDALELWSLVMLFSLTALQLYFLIAGVIREKRREREFNEAHERVSRMLVEAQEHLDATRRIREEHEAVVESHRDGRCALPSPARR